MTVFNKVKLVLSNPISSLIHFISSYFQSRKLVFKKRMLWSKYNIDESVGLHNNTYIYGNGLISIKENTYFGKNTFVVSNPAEASITFGKNCRISHGCHFRTEDNDPETLRFNKPNKLHKNITIGDNCWIGANVFVRGGIELGHNVTVGANSGVLSSFPSDVIIGGAPAKILKKL